MKKQKAEEPKPDKFNPKDEWKGMPEFNQPDGGPIKSIIVNFDNKEDMHKFSKLIGQPITARTRSVWYPAVPEEGALDKRYVDKKK